MYIDNENGGASVSEPRYSVATWDTNKQAYTPQRGLSVPSFNISRTQLRVALKELRRIGYQAHRKRDSDGSYDNNDSNVLVERTDGMHWKEIMRGWIRYRSKRSNPQPIRAW